MTDDSLKDLIEKEKPVPQSSDPAVSISGILISYSIVALVFLAAGVFIGMNVSGNADEALTADDVREIVKDAIGELELTGGATDRFELVDDDPYLGEEDAPIVLVEFSDFRCPYCGRHYEETLDPLMENYGEHIRYVFRDFPALGQESLQAALAAECADDQGKFWEFHNTFYENQESLSYEYYIAVAERFELDVETFTTCLDEQQHRQEIDVDAIDGQINGVSGTPGFFINGTFIRGAQPYEVFERFILRELRDAEIEVNVVDDDA